MTDLFIVTLENKSIVYIQTENGRFYDITGYKPVKVLAVADQLALCETEEYQHVRIQAKGKATSKRNRRKEVHYIQ